VRASGTVDENHARNIGDANVTHPSTGIYCFVNLPFTVGVLVATPDFDTAPSDRRVFIQARATGPILPCPAGSVSVATYDSAGTAVDAGFQVAFV
jgi:hypothetical protein